MDPKGDLNLNWYCFSTLNELFKFLLNIIHWLRALPVCAQWSMTALISDCCVCAHWIVTGNPGIFWWVQPFMPIIIRSALRSTDTSGTIMDDATFKAHCLGALCDSEIIKKFQDILRPSCNEIGDTIAIRTTHVLKEELKKRDDIIAINHQCPARQDGRNGTVDAQGVHEGPGP